MNIKNMKKPKITMLIFMVLAVIAVTSTALSFDSEDSDASTLITIDLGTITVAQGEYIRVQSTTQIAFTDIATDIWTNEHPSNYPWVKGTFVPVDPLQWTGPWVAVISGQAPFAAGTYNVVVTTNTTALSGEPDNFFKLTLKIIVPQEYNTFTLVYDAQGGSPTPPPSTVTSINSTFTHVIDSWYRPGGANAPTKANYQFMGWALSPGGQVLAQPYVESTPGTKTIYAIWADSTPKTLSFNANGGTGTVPSQNLIPGNTINLPSVGFTKDGYYQSAWRGNGTPDYARYSMGASFTMGFVSRSLDAEWTALPTDARFDPNAPSTAVVGNSWSYKPDVSRFASSPYDRYFEGLRGHNLNMISSPSGFVYGTSNHNYVVEFSWIPPNPGIYLIHFNLKYTIAGISSVFKDTDVYFLITVYPTKQTSPATYTLNYDANGGNGEIPPIVGIMPNNAVLLAGQIFTRPGYTQTGWEGTVNGVKSLFFLGSHFPVNANITMKAHWLPAANLVVFNANGGTGMIDPYIAYTDGQITLPSTGMTREGYSFEGWFLRTAPDAIYPKGYIYTIGDNVTFYAYWIANGAATYAVNIDSNGGTGGYSQIVEPGKGVVLPLAGVQKLNNNLKGFHTSSVAVNPAYLPKDVFTPSGNTTLYALWLDTTTGTFFVVSFNLNGGSGSVIPQTVASGEVATRPGITPTKSASLFRDWYKQNDPNVWNFATPIMQNTTLMAEYDLHFSTSQKDLTMTIIISNRFAGSSTINWGDGTEVSITGTTATHTYQSNSNGTMTVTSIVDAVSRTSTMPFAVSDGGGGGGGEEDKTDWLLVIHVLLMLLILIILACVTYALFRFLGMPGLLVGCIISLAVIAYFVLEWFL